MLKHDRNLYRLTTASLILPVWLSGCPTTSTGIDLSVRGGLVMEITEDSDSGNSMVTARIRNTLGGPSMLLTDDQSLAVNGGLLRQEFLAGLTGQMSATLRATDTYDVDFQDGGASGSMTVFQRTELTDVAVSLDADQVSVTWTPSGDSDVLVEVRIDGLTKSELDDNGAYRLTQEDLDNLERGRHTVTVRRFRTESAAPAFADLLESAEIDVGVQREIDFTF